MSAVIMVVVGSKKFHKAGPGEQVLLGAEHREETPLRILDCGLQNMVIEQVDFDVLLNQTGCSTEVIARGKVCD